MLSKGFSLAAAALVPVASALFTDLETGQQPGKHQFCSVLSVGQSHNLRAVLRFNCGILASKTVLKVETGPDLV